MPEDIIKRARETLYFGCHLQKGDKNAFIVRAARDLVELIDEVECLRQTIQTAVYSDGIHPEYIPEKRKNDADSK